MTEQYNNLINTTTLQKEFWDSLQSDILVSNQKLTIDDLYSYVEQNFMFSLFFRGTSNHELLCFQSLYHIENYAYLILLELLPGEKSNLIDIEIEEKSFIQIIKRALPSDKTHAVGPLISNRISILISDKGNAITAPDQKTESLSIVRNIIDAIQKEYQLSAMAGIGNIYGIHSVYSSFTEALSCMHLCTPGQGLHIQDADKIIQNDHFDYLEAEKHMLDSIRLRKVEAYDYFVLMMDSIRPLNDNAKRNKIIEVLILATHEMQIDGATTTNYINYTRHINQLMDLAGDQLIEWAFQRFMDITGFVKPQSSFDYSNKIVQITKEYLELHYAEEISLEDIAEQVNISPQYFSKLIKKNTGFNFIDWLSMLRVKKAKELLTNSNYTVKEVCFMVGYKDPNYFSRIFKKRIGITPSEYIKNRAYSNNKN